MPERLSRASRAAPSGAIPPLGQDQHNLPPSLPTRVSGLPARICLRKGCGRIFQPRRWNQRYCQDPECLRLVHRWQAAKRQQHRRSHLEVRQERAATARQRRRDEACRVEPPAPQALTAGGPKTDTAWSRSKRNSAPFCDRPGCYEAPRPSCRCEARYCGDECSRSVRRVRDRERKWLSRKTAAGRFKRQLEYQARRIARRGSETIPLNRRTGDASDAVVSYESPSHANLSCGELNERFANDPKTPARHRPRAPPSA